jgi:hypothetical protein
MTYLVYHLSDYTDETGSPPIAASQDKDVALGKAAQRVLTIGWLDGGLTVVERNDITEAEAESIDAAVSAYFNNA